MKKIEVDNVKFYELTCAMMNCGIDSQVFNMARKMDFNLPYLFYEKLILNRNDESKKQLSKNLLGIYGNLIAHNYFLGLGYNAINECPVYDADGNEITKADIFFVDNNGVENYCEVKTVSQIIDNIRNYVDEEEDLTAVYTDKDNEIIKYKNIGKKLVKQVEKISGEQKKVNVVVFNGCYIDEVIQDKLKKSNANIITMACDIRELDEYVEKIVDDVDNIVNRKVAKKVLRVV